MSWHPDLVKSLKWQPCGLLVKEDIITQDYEDLGISRFHFDYYKHFNHKCYNRLLSTIHSNVSIPSVRTASSMKAYLELWEPWCYRHTDNVWESGDATELLERKSLIAIFPIMSYHNLIIVIYVDTEVGIVVSARAIDCKTTSNCAAQLDIFMNDSDSPAHAFILKNADYFLHSIRAIQYQYPSIRTLSFVGHGLGGAMIQTIMALYLNYILTPEQYIHQKFDHIHLVTFNSFGVSESFRDLSCLWLIKFLQFFRETAVTMVHAFRSNDLAHRGWVYVCQQPQWKTYPVGCTIAVAVLTRTEKPKIEVIKSATPVSVESTLDDDEDDKEDAAEDVQKGEMLLNEIRDSYLNFSDRRFTLTWCTNEYREWDYFSGHLNLKWVDWANRGIESGLFIIFNVIPGAAMLNNFVKNITFRFIKFLFTNFLRYLSGDIQNAKQGNSKIYRLLKMIWDNESRLIFENTPAYVRDIVKSVAASNDPTVFPILYY